MRYDIENILEERILQIGPTQTAKWCLLPDNQGNTAWVPCLFSSQTGEFLHHPVWMPLPGSQKAFLNSPVFETMFHGNRGGGKEVLDSEPVLTDSGWKRADEVTYDDKLVAVDGSYTDLLEIHPSVGESDIARVTFDDGATLDVSWDHLWSFRRGKDWKNTGWRVQTTKELKSRLDLDAKNPYKSAILIPMLENPAPGPQWDGLDPYMLGLLLGGGTTGSEYITLYSADDFILDYAVEKHAWKRYSYAANTVDRVCCCTLTNEAWKDAVGRAKGPDKAVDLRLLTADPESRLACLQGLMDSDGSIDEDGRCSFTSVSEQLTRDVVYLARSLGGKASYRWKSHKSTKGGGDGYWSARIIHCNRFNPFRLPRKAERVKRMKGTYRRIVSIEAAGVGTARCFKVAHPEHLFVAKDFIVTHNTLILLFDFAQEVGKGYEDAWRGILFRKRFGDLDDAVRKIEDWFPKIWPGFKFLKSKSEYMATWPSGEALLLRHMIDERDYDDYHGHEYPWIGWEELTQWETDKAYKLMMSCSRPPRAGVPTRVRSTTNPSGAGNNWVKRRFRLPDMDGRIIRPPGEMPRVAIKGSMLENFVLLHTQPMYRRIISQAAKSPAQAKAWMDGDWNQTDGGLFDDLWDAEAHVIPPIPPRLIPRGWEIMRAYDHGSSHPFAVGWFLQSNGEPLKLPTGEEIGRIRGDRILWKTWYGSQPGEDNVGLRMTASTIAEGIRDMEEDWGVRGRVVPGPADTEIFNKNYTINNSRSPADDMEEEGIDWEKADKSQGSRHRGWLILRQMLKNAIPDNYGVREKAGLYVCSDNRQWIDLVPPMPRDEKDPDDCPKNFPDHLGDMTRYYITFESREGHSRGF